MRFVLSVLLAVIFSVSVFGQATPSPDRSVEEEAEIIYKQLKAEEAAATRRAAAEQLVRERLARERAETERLERRRAGERKVFTIEGVEYAFRFCPAGEFMMGSPKSEAVRDDDEIPHRVTLTKGFWLLETEVTQAMWESVMGSNPSHFKGKKLPVEQVSWDDCQEFIRKLNQQTKPQGFKFSLPTEAQWEYACRAGTSTPFSFGSVLNGDKANCDGNYLYGTDTKGKYLARTAAVGLYPANAWGLYDMHGNVWEWCSDWYSDYPSGSVTVTLLVLVRLVAPTV